MNKRIMIQFVNLGEHLAEELDADTPQFDDIGFTPALSSRDDHIDAVLSLTEDVADSVAPEQSDSDTGGFVFPEDDTELLTA